MHTAFIAIGSNLGERRALCSAAVARWRMVGHTSVRHVSTLLEYPALTQPPHDPQPAYLNGVLCLHTALSPWEILHRCHTIEAALGRVRPVRRWQPRPIDLDLLAYDDVVLNTPTLTLPHPELHTRRFVLEPLAEIAPHWRHPQLNQTAHQLRLDIKA